MVEHIKALLGSALLLLLGWGVQVTWPEASPALIWSLAAAALIGWLAIHYRARLIPYFRKRLTASTTFAPAQAVARVNIRRRDPPPPIFGKDPFRWLKRKRAQRHARSEDFRSFDVPIRKAVNHYARTESHSHTGNADLHAFRALHEAMCEGVLRVVGSKGEGGVPREISAREYRRLTPRMVIIPRLPTSPEGVRFDLIDESTVAKPLLETDKPIGFTGLRIRSDELYRLWPKNKEATTRGISDLQRCLDELIKYSGFPLTGKVTPEQIEASPCSFASPIPCMRHPRRTRRAPSQDRKGSDRDEPYRMD